MKINKVKNITLLKNKDKLVIIEELIPGGMSELNHELESPISDKYKSRIIRKHFGRICTYCYGVPTKKVSSDVGNAKQVEWYSDSSFVLYEE
jgi:hypothetical protein